MWKKSLDFQLFETHFITPYGQFKKLWDLFYLKRFCDERYYLVQHPVSFTQNHAQVDILKYMHMWIY